MNCFSVPSALNENNKLVSPGNAVKGTNYYCPSCKELVVLRKGNIRVHHFSHKPSKACSYDNVLHKTAIRILTDALKQNIEVDGLLIRVERKCLICDQAIFQSIPKDYTSVANEFKLDDLNIADIALLKGETVKAFFEIKITHKIDESKRIALGIPFIELDGQQVIDNHNELYPVLDHFKPYYCKECNELNKIYDTEVNIFCKKHKIELPKSFYRYVLNRCPKCGKLILIYLWPDNKSLLLPIPKTIRTMKLTSYYINYCIYCGCIQKNSDLIDSNNGLFHKFKLTDDFYNDIRLLKLRAIRQINLTTAST